MAELLIVRIISKLEDGDAIVELETKRVDQVIQYYDI